MSGSLSARQSRTNQPPGSDAVAVPLALARPTTEWHQHIQNRRSDPHIAAQIVCVQLVVAGLVTMIFRV